MRVKQPHPHPPNYKLREAPNLSRKIVTLRQSNLPLPSRSPKNRHPHWVECSFTFPQPKLQHPPLTRNHVRKVLSGCLMFVHTCGQIRWEEGNTFKTLKDPLSASKFYFLLFPSLLPKYSARLKLALCELKLDSTRLTKFLLKAISMPNVGTKGWVKGADFVLCMKREQFEWQKNLPLKNSLKAEIHIFL